MADDIYSVLLRIEGHLDTSRSTRNVEKTTTAIREFDRVSRIAFGTTIGGLAVNAVQSLVRELGRLPIEVTRNLVTTDMQMFRLQNTFEAATGSVAGMRRELEYLGRTSSRYGTDLLEGGSAYSRLFTAGMLSGDFSIEETRAMYEGLSASSVVLGRTSSETALMFRAFEQMISKGIVTSEELKQQLGDQLPGAIGIAADAMGMALPEFLKLLESGEILAKDLLPRMTEKLLELYGPRVEQAASKTAGAHARFRNELFLLQAELAEGEFIDAYIEAVETLTRLFQDDALKADLKTLVEDLGAMIGFLARQTDNLAEAYKRFSAVMKLEIGGPDGAGWEEFLNAIRGITDEAAVIELPPIVKETGGGGSGDDAADPGPSIDGLKEALTIERLKGELAELNGQEEQLLASQVAQGDILAQLVDAYRALGDEANALKAELDWGKLLQDMEAGEATGLARFEDQLEELRKGASLDQTLPDAGIATLQAGIDGLSSSLYNLIVGLEDGGEAWLAFGQTALRAITDIVAEQLALAAVQQTVNAIKGAAGFSKQEEVPGASAEVTQKGAGALFKSIMDLGPIAGPAVFAAAIAGGVALVSSLSGGFRKGGYTGDGPADGVAGAVHYGEEVFSREDNARWGGARNVELLRTMGPSGLVRIPGVISQALSGVEAQAGLSNMARSVTPAVRAPAASGNPSGGSSPSSTVTASDPPAAWQPKILQIEPGARVANLKTPLEDDKHLLRARRG